MFCNNSYSLHLCYQSYSGFTKLIFWNGSERSNVACWIAMGNAFHKEVTDRERKTWTTGQGRTVWGTQLSILVCSVLTLHILKSVSTKILPKYLSPLVILNRIWCLKTCSERSSNQLHKCFARVHGSIGETLLFSKINQKQASEIK